MSVSSGAYARMVKEMEAENERLREALQTAYDAIVHAENYHQEAHVADHLRKAKLSIVDVLYKEHTNDE